jgi:hypothetical protein
MGFRKKKEDMPTIHLQHLSLMQVSRSYSGHLDPEENSCYPLDRRLGCNQSWSVQPEAGDFTELP